MIDYMKKAGARMEHVVQTFEDRKEKQLTNSDNKNVIVGLKLQFKKDKHFQLSDARQTLT